jgi:uncharacterized protein YndB with AHSA1/START domain
MGRVSFEIEFIFKASPAMLYNFLTSPEGLVRWFCDAVDIHNDIYDFYWDGSVESAELIDDIEEERLRFHWMEAEEPGEFFEFIMYKSEITNETILKIVDFCDRDELDEQKELWSSQIAELQKAIGG